MRFPHPFSRLLKARLWPILVPALFATNLYAQAPGTNSDDQGTVVAKFDKINDAQILEKELRSRGQIVQTRVQTEQIVLKTLTLGPYGSQADAEKVETDLKINKIDARVTHPRPDTFWVQAGAIHGEVFFRDRQEKLRGLGYQNIATGSMPYNANRYLVVVFGDDAAPKVSESQPVNVALTTDFTRWSSARGNYTGEHLQLRASQQWKGQIWEAALGAVGDSYELGENGLQYHMEGDFLPTYLALRLGSHRLLAGMDNTNWTDANNRTRSGDLIQRRDLFYYQSSSHDDQPDRPTSLVRWQIVEESYVFDLLWNPRFRETRLSPESSIWYPVDTQRGRIRGLLTTDTLASLVKGAKITDDSPTEGGYAIHLSRSRGDSAQSITASYAPYPEPYFHADPSSPGRVALVHPTTAAISLEEHARDWQFEVTFTDKVPVTTFNYELASSFATQLYAQLRGDAPKSRLSWRSSIDIMRLETVDQILDRRTRTRLTAAFENRGRGTGWRGGTEVVAGVDMKEAYLRPYLAYRQSRQSNLQLEVQAYGGEDGSEFGFHHRQTLIRLAWQSFL